MPASEIPCRFATVVQETKGFGCGVWGLGFRVECREYSSSKDYVRMASTEGKNENNNRNHAGV